MSISQELSLNNAIHESSLYKYETNKYESLWMDSRIYYSRSHFRDHLSASGEPEGPLYLRTSSKVVDMCVEYLSLKRFMKFMHWKKGDEFPMLQHRRNIQPVDRKWSRWLMSQNGNTLSYIQYAKSGRNEEYFSGGHRPVLHYILNEFFINKS